MTENEKIELFDKWYDENYDEWAEGEEGIALREELEQAFKSGIAELEKENAELKKLKRDCETSLCRAEYQWMYERFEKSKEIIKKLINACCSYGATGRATAEAEQFISEVEK